MNILFITNHLFSNKVCNGGGICAKRNFEILKRIVGKKNIYKCIITYEKHEKGDEHTKYIEIVPSLFGMYFNYMLGRSRYSKKNEKELLDYIRSIKPSLIFFDGTTFGAIVDKIDQNIKTVVFFHNLEKNYAWMCFRYKNPVCIIKYFSDYYNERTITQKADKIICLNERDRNLIVNTYHRSPDMVWPITLKDNYRDCGAMKLNNSILFVGSYFTPNIEGIRWFAKNVMSAIGCKLIVVGKDMEKLTDISDMTNIDIVGTVDDLKPFYQAADAVVMPIFLGAGMKIKTAEAMMYGKTIFATKEALEGYEVKDVNGIYECNTAQEFIENINNYYSEDENKKFNKSVRNKFLNEFEDEIKFNEVSSLIKSIWL